LADPLPPNAKTDGKYRLQTVDARRVGGQHESAIFRQKTNHGRCMRTGMAFTSYVEKKKKKKIKTWKRKNSRKKKRSVAPQH